MKINSGNKKDIKRLNEKIAQFISAFGNEPYTTFAYHHQWLFGRGALLAASRMVEFNQECDVASNPFKNETHVTGDDLIHLQNNLLSLFNSKLAKLIGRFGYEKFHLLNFIEPGMRTDCSGGDNNDGIFVINCKEDSYCFVNIGTGDTTVSQLPVLEPCSADQYVRLYYPCEPMDSTTAKIPDSLEEQELLFKNNRRMNRLFTKPFETYKLMSRKELERIFPDSFSKPIKTENQIQKCL